MAVQNVPSATQYGTTQTRRERSFAELYRQARQAQVNDNGSAPSVDSGSVDQQETETRRNRAYIADLHDRVDTLRGEIIARVVVAAPDETKTVSQDVSRLSTRLESLRSKLHDEEQRLSGHLVDVTV